MSMHAYYYVGPYLECQTGQRMGQRAVNGCTNKKCAAHKHRTPQASKFCPECGAAIGKIEYQEAESSVSADELAEDINEALTDIQLSDTVHLWMPNEQREAPREMHLDQDPDGVGVTPLAPTAISQEMDWFRGAFKKEIDMIRAAYGDHNVTVRWGIQWSWM